MSRLYDNIKALCRFKGVKMRDIEAPLKPGTISRYERRGTIDNLPIWLIYKAAKMLGVAVEDLLEKDMANELKLEEQKKKIYGVFRQCELSDDLIEDLKEQVDIILEYANRGKAKRCA